jgi:dTDP-4-amino-4,6-dideoxygalactose transaminase/thymidylate kinase
VPGRFLALEGPDGVGKTTLAAQVATCSYNDVITAHHQLFPQADLEGPCPPCPVEIPAVADGDPPLVFVPRRQISATSPYAASLMRQLATMLWHSGDAPDLPDTFWIGLQAAWFTAHGEAVLAPLLDSGHDVIVDGWIYKFWSKLLLQGHTQTDLEVIFQRVRFPDAVVLLAANPADLYDRGRHFRPAELGMHAGYSELNRDTFIDYQRAGLQHLHGYAERHNWTVVDLDPAAAREQSAARLATVIAQLGITEPRFSGLGIAESGTTPAPAPPGGVTMTPALAAHGGTPTLNVDGPHYHWPTIDAAFEEAVRAQLHRSLSDRDARGVIGEYEAAFADFIGTPHAVSFASGTAAIHAMSRIAGLKPGDAVIAPAYTFFATASPFGFDGITVRFADADAYGNVTAATIAAQLAPDVKAVIITHMWGSPCAMDDIAALCTEHGVLLLEDCSHAHFASWHGQRVGTFGDMAVFSTNQKAITTGEGGMLVTANDRYRQLALLYGHYNKRCLTEIAPDAEFAAYAFTGMGLKHRITTLGAAIGLHQLGRAADIQRRRRANLSTYVKGMDGNPVVSAVTVPDGQGEHGLYVIGLRFHPENATVTRKQFIELCVAEGATQVDAPGSTRNISAEPLFTRRDPFAPWQRPGHLQPADLPGVRAFQGAFMKIPIWGYPGDTELVDGYLAALTKVSAAVAR